MRLLTRSEVAAELELTPQAVSLLAKEPDCPREMQGAKQLFRWPEMNRWYWSRKLAEVRDAVRPADFEEARARREAANAELAELELARQRGELMTVAQYAKEVGGAFERVAARLTTFADKAAREVVGTKDVLDGRARLQPLVDEVMGELYRSDDVPADEPADEPEAEAA